MIKRHDISNSSKLYMPYFIYAIIQSGSNSYQTIIPYPIYNYDTIIGFTILYIN